MFGTVARFWFEPGKEAQAMKMVEEWWNSDRRKQVGATAQTIYRRTSDPTEYVVAVVFESREAYEANAASPEQDQWYREMRALMTRDPEWMDGEVVRRMG
jgi:quinol monooxygenase YgiN